MSNRKGLEIAFEIEIEIVVENLEGRRGKRGSEQPALVARDAYVHMPPE